MGKSYANTQIEHRLRLDRVYFDHMIDEANDEGAICSLVRFLPSYSYMSRLWSWGPRKPRPVTVSRSILGDNPEEEVDQAASPGTSVVLPSSRKALGEANDGFTLPLKRDA